MNILLPIFIGTSIFGVGVTLIDMLGLLGSQFGESHGDTDSGNDGGDTAVETDVNTDGDGDVDTDMDGDGDADTDTDSDGTDIDAETDSDADVGTDGAIHSEDTDTESDADDADEDTDSEGKEGGANQSIVAHDYSPKKNVLLKVLTVMRNLVYFCFGFGPVGWFTLGTGSSGIVSLAWAVPVGILTLAGARLLKRIQRKKLDSQVQESELLMEMAEVLVTIEKGQLGKVRILYSDTFVDRYAKAQDPGQRYAAGTKVRVVNITDEYVFVSADE
ncbi:MAG: hypothetical protein JXB88_23210 [Spirochaetales bacterium]|nr:hypothetical protein [Spirochaetales bacterium]